MPVLDNYVSVVEAGQILGVHWETVKRMCREGRIQASKVHNMWLIDQDDLARFAATYDDPHRGRRRQKTATDA
ncbi:MAG: helix-turn-helix domain-containing protein [Dehalococcoidia bacterium]|nr:helix-turn-helix domain-containing protein [Dehalococcoidia bacterium]